MAQFFLLGGPNVTRDTLYASSEQHIADVRAALAFFGWKLDEAAQRHDFDKGLKEKGAVARPSIRFNAALRTCRWISRNATCLHCKAFSLIRQSH